MEEAKQLKIKIGDVIGTALTLLFVGGLLTVIVWQQLTISDLRVEVVEASHLATEETREMMIDKYWAEQKADYAVIQSGVLYETVRAVLESYEELR